MDTHPTLFRPRSVAEAVELLARHPEAKPISGGATLVAMINARVIAPEQLVSLAGIPELKGITELADGRIRIGGFTRHRETAESRLTTGTRRLVSHAASQIANATVRNMGTIGGSISFADPGLDYPPALVAVGAEVHIAGAAGERSVPAKDFFVDWYTTALAPGEIVTAVVLPASHATGHGLYLKHARVVGDYATASVAVCASASGTWRVAIGGCGPTPLSHADVDQALGAARDEASLVRAAALLVELADPLDDVRGTADYRRRLIPRMLVSAVRQLDDEMGGAQ
ncbi:FAD binding domain-containing protein [Hydrogenophaga sp. OTU3427]|uniref:FAD binding domain-containing protein n=1 Tax=Hydrogenophaga sp. OTU3427 TaxID=3043856 RepID=UPI00313B4856